MAKKVTKKVTKKRVRKNVERGHWTAFLWRERMFPNRMS